MPNYEPQYYDMSLRADEEQSANTFVADCINYQVVECDYNYQFWKDSYHSRSTSQQHYQGSRPSTNNFMLKKRPGLDTMQFLYDTGCDGNYQDVNAFLASENMQVLSIEIVDGERIVLMGSVTTGRLKLFKELTNGKESPCLDNIKSVCETQAVFLYMGVDRERDTCSMPKLLKHMRVKGSPKTTTAGTRAFIMADAIGNPRVYLDGISADVGDFVFITSSYLAGQYVQVLQTGVSYVNDMGESVTGIEVTPIKGFNIIGSYSTVFTTTVHDKVGEIVSFPAKKGIVHVHHIGLNSCDFYYQFDGNTLDSGQVISGMGMTSRGGVSYIDLNNGTFIYGEPGSQAFYTGNFEPMSRSYTDAMYLYDQYIVLLGTDSMMGLRPIYDTQGQFVRVDQQLISDTIGYFSRGSRDVDNTYGVIMASNHTLYMLIAEVQYNNLQFKLEPIYNKYDEDFSVLNDVDNNVYISANNREWFIFVTSAQNRSETGACIYTKVYQRNGKNSFWHRHIYDNKIIRGYKNKTWFGQYIYCENCEGTDDGLYFKTSIIFRHGEYTMYSPKLLTYARYMFGNGTRFVKDDNRITYGFEHAGRYREVTHAGFMQTRFMQYMSHQVNDDCRSVLPEQTSQISCDAYGNIVYDGHGRDNRSRHITHCLEHKGYQQRNPTIRQDRSTIRNSSLGLSTQFAVGKVGILNDNTQEHYNIMFINLETTGAGCFDLYGLFISFVYPEIDMFNQLDNMVYDHNEMYEDNPLNPGRSVKYT